MEATWNKSNLQNFSVFEKTLMVDCYLESSDSCLTKLQPALRLRVVVLTFCWASLTAGSHGQLKFITVLNCFSTVTAVLGNTLILVALRRVSLLHPPSKLLLRNLATTNLCVGLISHPLLVILLLAVMNESWDICQYSKGVARKGGVLGYPWPPFCKPFCKQTTHNIQVTILWVSSVWPSVRPPLKNPGYALVLISQCF